MKRNASLLLILLAAAGCGSAKPNEPTPPPPDASKAPLHDAATPQAKGPEIKAHMREHFAVVSALQLAIARGQLAEAQGYATWLGSHVEPDVEGWAPYVAALKTAAQNVAAAKDLPGAAAVAPALARACASCHQAQGAIVAFTWAEAPEPSDDLPSQMKRHQWAAARLWDGLVGPSDTLWREGAAVLATTKLDAVGAAGGVPRGDVGALASNIRQLATKAEALTDQDERAALYGELLSTCAGCHMLVRPQPVTKTAPPAENK